MAKKKEFVEHITSQAEDFSRWYTDVIKNADMVDYSDVKGCMVIKPYGYGIWELIQKEMDARFKATGHKNAYFPMLIPESLLMKEAEHVEGFAPEVAWVTQGGTEPLQERLAIRPTSETIICSMYSRWVQSYRDLPLKLNQWCSVLRWEKTTRPFLRTSEFLWQEGHTVHETQAEAEEETMRMIRVYKEFAENVLAIPVIAGQKSEKEKFAGADHTYTMEAMMLDGRALQMGTSHNLGQNFAKGFDIKYLSREGKQEYVWQTSWGTSTRMIGGLIMVHGDDRGLKLPPKVAPIQCMVIPVAAHKPGVLDKARELTAALAAAGIRTEIDEREQSVGWKFNDCELRASRCASSSARRTSSRDRWWPCAVIPLKRSRCPGKGWRKRSFRFWRRFTRTCSRWPRHIATRRFFRPRISTNSAKVSTRARALCARPGVVKPPANWKSRPRRARPRAACRSTNMRLWMGSAYIAVSPPRRSCISADRTKQKQMKKAPAQGAFLRNANRLRGCRSSAGRRAFSGHRIWGCAVPRRYARRTAGNICRARARGRQP